MPRPIVPSVKPPFVGCFVALGLTAIAANAAPPPAAAPKLTKWQQQQQKNYNNSAPADEYFGRAKMSYLGMNITFRDSAISSGAHTTDPAIVNKVAQAEDALGAWARKYPRDPQLARTYFLATQVDRKIWIKANQDRAWVYLNRLVQSFGSTYFGKLMKRDLATGFTEHYYALPLPCAPAASPTEEPSGAPAETTPAKGLRVQIIPQACVPQPTPSPSPSLSPTPEPSPDAAADATSTP